MNYPLFFRKSSQDEDVITLAKNLIKAWKKFLPDNSSTSSGNSEKEKKVCIVDKYRQNLGTGIIFDSMPQNLILTLRL